MSDITMDCDKCQEFQYMKGRVDVIDELMELLPDCDRVEIEHLICLMEKVKEQKNERSN